MANLTPHKPASLILAWAQHVSSGAADVGWYELEYRITGIKQGWTDNPSEVVA